MSLRERKRAAFVSSKCLSCVFFVSLSSKKYGGVVGVWGFLFVFFTR